MGENPCERLYRHLRVDRIWEGTSEIRRVIVANEVAKRGLDGLLSYVTSPELVVEAAAVWRLQRARRGRGAPS